MARRDSDDDSPWLAEAGGPQQTTVSKRSFFWTALGLLVLVAVAAIGLILLMAKKDGGSTQGYMEAGQAPLISAEPGPYKISPLDPKGLAVEGQDQTIYAAGEGIEQGSTIDQSAVPETPLPRPGSAAVPGPPPRNIMPDAAPNAGPNTAPTLVPSAPPPAATVTPPTATVAPPAATAKPLAATVAPPAPKAEPPRPVAARPAPVRPDTTKIILPAAVLAKPVVPQSDAAKPATTVQLGAFSSEDKANSVWAGLVARHAMAGFGKRISPVDRDGRTLWRLRGVGGDAGALCAKLKAAGDACSVVE